MTEQDSEWCSKVGTGTGARIPFFPTQGSYGPLPSSPPHHIATPLRTARQTQSCSYSCLQILPAY